MSVQMFWVILVIVVAVVVAINFADTGEGILMTRSSASKTSLRSQCIKGRKVKELSLHEIQQEITRWGLRQFGDQNRSAYVGDPSCGTPMGSLIQLCGVATEVSEIMRPVIEMHQGRWNKSMTEGERKAALREALTDGAADLLIWLCHWAGLNDIDLQHELNRVWHERVQHRTRKDWEKIKAEEADFEKGCVADEDIYRRSCCEAMKPGEKTNAPSRGAKFVAESTCKTNSLSRSAVCPKCKTKFSDLAPNYCPECGLPQIACARG